MDTFRCSALQPDALPCEADEYYSCLRLHNCCLVQSPHRTAQHCRLRYTLTQSPDTLSPSMCVCASASCPFTEMQRMDLQLALRYTRYTLHNRLEEPIFIAGTAWRESNDVYTRHDSCMHTVFLSSFSCPFAFASNVNSTLTPSGTSESQYIEAWHVCI